MLLLTLPSSFKWDESKGQTRLRKGNGFGVAEKRVLVSWKPLPFTCYSEIWKRKAGCSSGKWGRELRE